LGPDNPRRVVEKWGPNTTFAHETGKPLLVVRAIPSKAARSFVGLVSLFPGENVNTA
jgi:hypothetical protein